MKNLLIIILFLINLSVIAQESHPKKVVEDFFIAFHAKDTITLKEWCHPEIVMQTIANTKEGNKLKTDEFSGFLKSIASIPMNMKFEERILNYHVQIQGKGEQNR